MKEFLCLKWFSGDPKTGGDMVFNFIIDAISEVRKTTVIQNPPKAMLARLGNNQVSRTLSVISRNIISRREVLLGKNVYSGLQSGTFEYIQPPPTLLSNSEIVKSNVLSVVDKISRLNQSNLELVIYASEFSRETHKQIGVKHEFVVNPPLYDSYENDLSEKQNIILSISRIHPSKRLEILGELSHRHKYKFIILGYLDKSMIKYYNYIKKSYPNLVIIPNASEDVKRKFLLKAKLYIHTGVGEAFSIGKLEAMNAGCIPLVPLLGGAKEEIPTYLVYSDTDDLSQKIEGLLDGYNKLKGYEMMELSKKYNLKDFKSRISYYIDNYME